MNKDASKTGSRRKTAHPDRAAAEAAHREHAGECGGGREKVSRFYM